MSATLTTSPKLQQGKGMSSSFSSAKRRTVAVLYLINSLIVNYAASLGATVPQKSRKCMNRLDGYKTAVMLMVVHVKSYTEMSESRQNQYGKILTNIERVINHHATDDKIDGDIFINAVLACTEDARLAIPKKNKHLAEAWDKITNTLVTLYQHRDPDFTAPEQEQGAILGDDLMAAVEDRLPWNYDLKMILPPVKIIKHRKEMVA